MERLLPTLHVALVSTLLLAGVPMLRANPVAGQEQKAPVRYVRVSTDSARLLNLADDKGMSVAQPKRGALLAVHDERVAGWLAVEIPGGFAAWVFGRYLEPTAEAGVYRVTRNAVNIRPGPSSDVTHFPLAQRLHAGDRVRVLETLDPEAPLSETWARILSPPGVRAWVRASSTAPLAAGQDGAALWLESLAATQTGPTPMVRPEVRPGTPAEAAAAVTPEAGLELEEDPEAIVRAQLEAAKELLRTESGRDAPDFAAVRGAFEAVLSAAPTGPLAIEARHTLERIGTLEEAARLRAQLLQERERRANLALDEQRAVWEASKKKDPFGGVFLVRGVLFRKADTNDTPRYYLQFDGDTVCELYCSTGRYDLDRFTGYYVGIQGAELRTVDSGIAGFDEPIPPVEISRLEILSRR